MSESTGFSAAEQAAIAERAQELRAQRGGRKKADALQDLLVKIEEMPEQDRAMAVGVHRIVTEVAPELEPRTWYGMPAWALDGEVLCFFTPSSKFDERYSSFGFNAAARLDEGSIWPTAFAVTEVDDAAAERIAQLMARALGD